MNSIGMLLIEDDQEQYDYLMYYPCIARFNPVGAQDLASAKERFDEMAVIHDNLIVILDSKFPDTLETLRNTSISIEDSDEWKNNDYKFMQHAMPIIGSVAEKNMLILANSSEASFNNGIIKKGWEYSERDSLDGQVIFEPADKDKIRIVLFSERFISLCS